MVWLRRFSEKLIDIGEVLSNIILLVPRLMIAGSEDVYYRFKYKEPSKEKMKPKFYILDEKMIRHFHSGRIIRDVDFDEFVKGTPHDNGWMFRKGDAYIVYEDLDCKNNIIRKAIKFACTKYSEYDMDPKNLDVMLELGVLREVDSRDLERFYPHLSKRVCKITGWDIPKNLKQRMKWIKSLKELRTETSGNTRMLWHHEYWDGPRSGVMLWKGEKCWFQLEHDYNIPLPLTRQDVKEFKEHMATKTEEERYDIEDWRDYDMWWEYKVYRIPAETMEAITYNHELFCKYVGTHTNYDENGCKHHNLALYTEHGKFYNDRNSQKKYDLDLSKCEVVGKFSL